MPVNMGRITFCFACLMGLIFSGAVMAEAASPDNSASSKSPESAGKPGVEKTLCVSLPMINQTKVIDDQTILFEMNNGKVWRNKLPYPCPSLKFEKRFSYKTSLGELCNTDVITVFSSDGMRGPTCGLGSFYLDKPVVKSKPAGADHGKADSTPAAKN